MSRVKLWCSFNKHNNFMQDKVFIVNVTKLHSLTQNNFPVQQVPVSLPKSWKKKTEVHHPVHPGVQIVKIRMVVCRIKKIWKTQKMD